MYGEEACVRTRVASMAWLMVVTILLTINAEQFASASDSPPDAFLSLNVSSVHESDNNGSCFTLKNYFDAGFCRLRRNRGRSRRMISGFLL